MLKATGMWLQTLLQGDRWEGKLACLDLSSILRKIELRWIDPRPPAFQRGISELSAVTGRSEQCRMSQTDQQVFHRKASCEWYKITAEWNFKRLLIFFFFWLVKMIFYTSLLGLALLSPSFKQPQRPARTRTRPSDDRETQDCQS